MTTSHPAPCAARRPWRAALVLAAAGLAAFARGAAAQAPSAAADSLAAAYGPADTLVVDSSRAVLAAEPLPAAPAESLPAAPGQAPAPPAAAEPFRVHTLQSRTAIASGRYHAGPLRRRLLGGGYREAWETPVPAPILDLDRTAGGLEAVEMGGGLQTRSLQLKGADGHTYVLRSVEKYADRSLAPVYRGSLVASLAQDQISASHPFAALVVPPLARAAGVYNTAPTLVVVPDSPRLGEHRPEFAGMLALFERKPDEDQSGMADFGFAKNIVGFEKLVEKIEEDSRNRVDERAYARARLFDMLIGDWDRHDDQWRWAEYDEPGPGARYVAIARDRDFAFSRFGGMITGVARRFSVMQARMLSSFDARLTNLTGLNYKGNKLDRRFTPSLTRADWVGLAEQMRALLTDDVIDEAAHAWPEPAYRLHGPALAAALKQRRDALPRAAAEYYDKLAHTVDIVGSNAAEVFEVERLPEGSVRVQMRAAGDEAGRVLVERTFLPGETEEVRLYGLGGDDRFRITGAARRSVRVRAIGGPGDDAFADDSDVAGRSRYTQIYDNYDGTALDVRSEARLHRAADAGINAYVMNRYETNRTGPVVSFAYSSSDGVYLGGGARIVRRGFRKEPYAARHTLKANYAPLSNHFNVSYDANAVRLWQGWDAGLRAAYTTENRLRHFYGLGNETPPDRERYRADLRIATIWPTLGRTLGPLRLQAGPFLEKGSIEPPYGRTVDDPATAYRPVDFVDPYFGGARAALSFDRRGEAGSGVRWNGDAAYYAGFRTVNHEFVQLASDLSLYQSLRLGLPLTAAVRVGGAKNFGDFPFYHANMIGGSSNLRGFRRTRFAGHSSAYTNAELRARLFMLNTYVARGDFGVLGFLDHGRVWADGERSAKWHQGYGGGLWFRPYNALTMSTSMGFSEEGSHFDFSFGFLF